MPSAQTTLAFFGVALLLALAPGPDNLFVLMQSAARGPRAGALVVFGLCTGLVVHTAAVALGLAALFAASVIAFQLLKIAGVLYLLYLAVEALRAPVPSTWRQDAAPAHALPLYARGVAMNLTNPKVVLFFLAFLPQFVDPARGRVALQVAWLGLVFVLATLIVFLSIALLAGYIGSWIRRSERAQLVLNRLAALVFAGLALRLVMTQR